MVLKSQLFPPVAYAQTGDYYSTNGYQQQEDYYSKHGYAQQEDYYSENAYHDNGSSRQQIKPCPSITAPQPSKNHVVDYQGYDQHNSGRYGNPHKYDDYNGHGYDKHSKGEHNGDGFYGQPHGYNNYDNYGYPRHPTGPKTYETIKYNYYAEGRERWPPYYEHKNQQNSAPNVAEWISRSLD